MLAFESLSQFGSLAIMNKLLDFHLFFFLIGAEVCGELLFLIFRLGSQCKPFNGTLA